MSRVLLLGMVVMAVTACGSSGLVLPGTRDAGPVPVRETNQEPVAALVTPLETTVRLDITAGSQGSLDVDGTVVSTRFSFGDTTPEVTGATATHAYERAGTYVITLVVTDNAGKEGRARQRITVAPPPDQVPPQVTALRVMLDGSPVLEGARVPGGAVLTVDVDAADTQGNLAQVSLVAQGALGAVPVTPGNSQMVSGASASAVFTVEAPHAAGALDLRALAQDVFANVSVERALALQVFLAGADSDGDGLPDGTDPDPAAFNGLRARVYRLTAFPRDLLQRQRAEAVWEEIRAATPVFTANVGQGYLSQPGSTAPVNTLPGLEGAPSAVTLWAVVYEGQLKVPPNADRVGVETGADDTSAVWLMENVVASADGEFARDFFRADRAPAQSGPVMVTAGQVPLRIMVAQEEGPHAWDTRFTFSNASGVVLPSANVGQAQFLAP
jgi:PKD repeat protein